ncbi:MAG: extensin family protein [Myxococcales bacterium]|nr:extensin family protein [Myxococcales bacterium]
MPTPPLPRLLTHIAVLGAASLLAACGSDAPSGPVSAFQAGTDADGSSFTADVGGDGSSGALDVGLDGGTGSPDTGVADSGVADSGVSDTGIADSGAPDTAIADSGSADTGPADTGTTDTGTADTGTTDAGTTDAGNGAKEFNGGFIGGACTSNSQCAYTGGSCLKDGAGFPKGMCSKSCTKFCPDQTGMSTTFCIESKTVKVSTPPGLCAVRCDYGKSPTGCRPGYKCVKLPRYGDPGTTKFACIPGTPTSGPAKTDCQKKLLARGVTFTAVPNPMGVPKGGTKKVCDIPDLLSVNPGMYGVGFRASSQTGTMVKMQMNCTFAHSVADMAQELAAKGVTEVVHYGTYNCRYISGTKSLSQHGYANALDVAGLKTKDGAYHSVLKDWEKGAKNPKTTSGKLLRWFADHMYAKHVFNIILTPEYNAAHANHFHVDNTPGSWYMQGFASMWIDHPGCSQPHAE